MKKSMNGGWEMTLVEGFVENVFWVGVEEEESGNNGNSYRACTSWCHGQHIMSDYQTQGRIYRIPQERATCKLDATHLLHKVS